jgi:hypothetical protein
LDHQRATSAGTDDYFDAGESNKSDQREFQLHGHAGGGEFLLSVGWQRIQRMYESGELFRLGSGQPHFLGGGSGHSW